MDNFLSPITTFWILSIIAFVFIILKRKKTAKIFLIIAFLDLFIFSVTPLPTYLLKKLEQQYIPINTNKLDKNLPIMVLGGGHTNDHNLPTTNQLSSVALPRLVEGVRLYKQINGSTFILSGYTNKNNAPHAEVMAKSAISLGVNKKDTIMLIKPGTTWDEAIAFKKRFGSKQKFILVTSASHMPRAMKAFKNQGLHPIAAPANFLIKDDYDKSIYNWKPSVSKIKHTEKALHEYVGILYYDWFKKE